MLSEVVQASMWGHSPGKEVNATVIRAMQGQTGGLGLAKYGPQSKMQPLVQSIQGLCLRSQGNLRINGFMR